MILYSAVRFLDLHSCRLVSNTLSSRASNRIDWFDGVAPCSRLEHRGRYKWMDAKLPLPLHEGQRPVNTY